MKIILLANSNSSHTMKWATSLAEKGFEIILFNFTENLTDIYKKYKNIIIESAGIPVTAQFEKRNSFLKTNLLKIYSNGEKVIQKYKPDILHSHYASSYGLIGALANFHPFIISVWGSDVFDFPNRSLIHRKVFKYNLSKSDKILSTSNFMAGEIEKNILQNRLKLRPLGLIWKNLKPSISKSLFEEKDVVIGT